MELNLHDEERLAGELVKMWEILSANEEHIRWVFAHTPSDTPNANLTHFLCTVVLGEVCYRRKSWTKEEAAK